MIKKITISIMVGGVLIANTFTDSKNELMWQDNVEAKTIKKDWQEAIDYCENLSLEGFEDWRLPKHNELRGITNKNQASPIIKKGFKNVVSENYWSSSADLHSSHNGWYVNFNYGYDGTSDKGKSRYVRCVRENR